MNFVCVVFELCDKMLTLSSMENLIVPCNLVTSCLTTKLRDFHYNQCFEERSGHVFV